MGHLLLFLAIIAAENPTNLSAHRFTPWLKCAACPRCSCNPMGQLSDIKLGIPEKHCKTGKNLRITHMKMQECGCRNGVAIAVRDSARQGGIQCFGRFPRMTQDFGILQLVNPY